MIDGVIFDCDGVLVDSESIAIRVDQELLAEAGWDLRLDEIIERFVGRSHEQFLSDVEAHLGHPLPATWDASSTARHRVALAESLRPVDGILEALDAVTVPTCVASSSSHDRLRFTLGLTGLWGRFDGCVFSASDVEHGKPAPDLFLHAAKSMGWTPGDCVVVEDSPFGVQAGLAAGMRVIAYTGGVHPVARLALPGVMLVSDMRDLPGLLTK